MVDCLPLSPYLYIYVIYISFPDFLTEVQYTGLKNRKSSLSKTLLSKILYLQDCPWKQASS